MMQNMEASLAEDHVDIQWLRRTGPAPHWLLCSGELFLSLTSTHTPEQLQCSCLDSIVDLALDVGVTDEPDPALAHSDLEPYCEQLAC